MGAEQYGFLVERQGDSVVISDSLGGGARFDAYDPRLGRLVAEWMAQTVRFYGTEIAENFGEEVEEDD